MKTRGRIRILFRNDQGIIAFPGETKYNNKVKCLIRRLGCREESGTREGSGREEELSKKKKTKTTPKPKPQPRPGPEPRGEEKAAETASKAPARGAKQEPPAGFRLQSPGRMLADFKRQTKEEQLNRGTLLVLILWMLLPVWAFLLYLLSWIVDGGMGSQDEVGVNFVYQAAFQYAGSFRVLGVVTVFMVLAHVLAFPRSWYHLKNVMKKEPWFLCLLFLLVWGLIGTIHSEDSFKAFSGSPLQYDGWSSYVIFAALFLLAFLMTGKEKRMVVYRVCTAVANPIVLLLLGQCFEWPGFHDMLFRAPCSVFFNMNHLGYYLGVSIVLLIGRMLFDRGKKRTVWYFLSYLFQIYGLMLNNTLGAYLAILIALVALYIFYFVNGHKFSLVCLLPVVGLAAVSGLYFTGLLPSSRSSNLLNDAMKTANELQGDETGKISDSAGSARMRLWREAVALIPEHPILGFGPNSMPDYYDKTFVRPHNTVLQLAVFHGIPGVAAYLGALLTLAFHQFRRLKKLEESVLIAMGGTIFYVLSAFVGVPMFYTSLYFFVLLAFAAARTRDDPLEGER